MICPVCGGQATQYNDNYWCPNCQIALGQKLEVEPLPPPPREIEREGGGFSKIFNFLVWMVMIVLLIVLVVLAAWSYFHGDSGGSSPAAP